MIIDKKEKVFLLHAKEYQCAMDVTLDYIGGKNLAESRGNSWIRTGR